MPVTPFQAKIAKLLSANRSSDSYLAGGAALHFEPNSIRYSNDLDYFHDSEVRVATAFEADDTLLKEAGINVSIELRQPGYVRAIVRENKDATKIEWAHDSAWRFMPTSFIEGRGYCLHPIDLAINKTLALAGRDEARDFLDVLYAHKNLLGLPGLVWAACGKDPGFSPDSLLELLQRKGRYQPVDFKRLRLTVEIDLHNLKHEWLEALEQTKKSIAMLPTAELGCLFFDKNDNRFKVPVQENPGSYVPHYATIGGVLPRIYSD
jgi:hypothetical protein